MMVEFVLLLAGSVVFPLFHCINSLYVVSRILPARSKRVRYGITTR